LNVINRSHRYCYHHNGPSGKCSLHATRQGGCYDGPDRIVTFMSSQRWYVTWSDPPPRFNALEVRQGIIGVYLLARPSCGRHRLVHVLHPYV